MTDHAATASAPLSGAKVLLIEVGGSHSEVLLSWCRDFTALGATVFVACPSVMWERLGVKDTATWVDIGGRRGLVGHLGTALRVRKAVKSLKISHVVLNTGSGTLVRDITQLLPKRCTVIGTLHNAEKLIRSFNQSRITRTVDTYAVLGPHLKSAVPDTCTTPIVVIPATAADPRFRASTIEPKRYSDDSQRSFDDSRRFTSSGSSKPLRVVIAGGINWRRRDYESLYANDGFARIGNNVRIVLAGGPDQEDIPRLQAMVAMARPDMFELYDDGGEGFIPHEAYARIVSEADIVLPLTHPSCQDYHRYVQYQITGAMSNAWAYAKPLMLERGFEKHPSLAASIFYDVAALPDILRRFADDRTLLAPHAVTPAFASDDVRRAVIADLFRSDRKRSA